VGVDWNATTAWWLATGVLVACELASGTFYLLMVALGCASGAVAGHLGLAPSIQIVIAAGVGAAATALWHFLRVRQPGVRPVQSNRDVNLDIGQSLEVPVWSHDGSARVQYRGAPWSVHYAGSGTPTPGTHVIVEIVGSQLRVAPATGH
jgi:membrane protein implicated in regulation of membrane protease activity